MPGSELTAFLTPELLEELGDAVTVIDSQWRYQFVSRNAAAAMGLTPEEAVGAYVWDLFPDVVGTPQHEASLRAMAERRRERVVWYFEGIGRWLEQQALPVGDGLVVLVNDITEQHRATERSQQLVDVGEALARTTSYQQVNEALTWYAYPLVGASGGSIVLADEERQVLRAVGWQGLSEEVMSAWHEYPLSLRTPGAEAYHSGLPVFVDSLEQARQGYPDIAATLASAGQSSMAALPLISAGSRLGSLVVTFERAGTLPVADRQFLTTVAAMAAQALLRARLLDAERRTISTLQRSLLPRQLPQIPSLAVAVRYVASDGTTDLGGDWYDVIPLPGGSAALVMGDVEGHDLAAAALMGLVRSAVRAYALEGHPPAIVAERSNRYLAGLSLERLVTMSYAQLYPAERLVTIVSAGHLPSQVVAATGDLSEIPAELGPPLGVFDDGMHWPETTSTLPAGASVAVFTDGLVEQRGSAIDAGVQRVRRVLHESCDQPAEVVADRLIGARSAGYDDVALLVAQLLGPATAGHRLSRQLPATPASVFLARRFARQLLGAWGVPPEAAEAAELVLSELVTNAARHSEEALDIAIEHRGSVLRLEVADDSHRMPHVTSGLAEEDTSGRGLLLVQALASRWGVESEEFSKRVWAELDLPG